MGLGVGVEKVAILICSRNAKVRVSSENYPSIARVDMKPKSGEAGLGHQCVAP